MTWIWITLAIILAFVLGGWLVWRFFIDIAASIIDSLFGGWFRGGMK